MEPGESVVVYRFDEQAGHPDRPGHLDEGGGGDSYQFPIHQIYAESSKVFLGPAEKDPAVWATKIS
ncbi:hypothetical protein OUZ56_012836 [Daphnia magna]|uniref:Uncharacterized protein n=1 Tax=Daphnia magna TaxID=35525 RepID=A0ABQ9Z473_9CRUS|nr:hypothetical protein OUZ56_012836 [Daphnia magna]